MTVVKLTALILAAGALLAADWEPVEATITAYCPCALCCGRRAVGLTADGTDVRSSPYGVAADPDRLPYGTSVYVPAGIGYLDQSRPDDRVFLVDDTGGLIRRRTRATGMIHLDLRFIHHRNAMRFGRQVATVWIWRD